MPQSRRYVRVIIPSFKRARIITTHKLLTDYEVCIPEGQKEEYVSAGIPEERILTHPDDVIGGPTKRDWILEHYSDTPMAMIDDDMVSFIRMYAEPGETLRMSDPESIHDLIDNLAEMAEDMGTKMYAFDAFGDVRKYNALDPFSLTGFIAGGFMGFLPGHKIRVDRRLITRGDFDVSLKNAYHNRTCLRSHQYSFVTREMYRLDGGMAAYRRESTDQESIALLESLWGKDRIRRSGKLTGGIETIAMALPY